MKTENRLNLRGKFVQRYNITKAKIEHFFIPANNLPAYSFAKFKQDLSANKIYGIQIDQLAYHNFHIN